MPRPNGSKALSFYITSENWPTAIDLCNSHPKSAKVWSVREGFFEGIKTSNVLPIHEACTAGAPTEVVLAIVDAYSDGIKTKESAYNRFPLHIACRKNANPEVIRLLMDKFPFAALEADSLGRLPLHYALSNGNTDETIEILLQKPNSARGSDKRGWVPLHVACQTGASLLTIRRLVTAYPEGVIDRTNKGTDVFECIEFTKAPNREEVKSVLQNVKVELDKNWREKTCRESELIVL